MSTEQATVDPYRALDAVLIPALRSGATSVEVPARVVAKLRYTDSYSHRAHWIPGWNDHESCGAMRQVENRHAEEWCLLPSEHGGDHGWAAR